MPWHANVVTTCSFNDVEPQIRNKVNEIAQDAGRGSHGRVTLTDQTTCDHWRAGPYRIFGTWNSTTATLTFIGHGRHVGTGNSSYEVYLCIGGTTNAKTT